ncbi:MAG: AmmeMemoRadiSam system protein B [Acidobacteria bacterium]|nr:AmmeMemoRadiSam system protein B [Acidobacteriota bacterium]
MSDLLPPLRMGLEFAPSPIAEQPGLMIRDPHQYSDAHLVIPPELVQALQFFDGNSSVLDLKRMLVDLLGRLDVSDIQEQLADALSEAGFLEDEVYFRLREEAHAEFEESPVRYPAFAGLAYPEGEEELRTEFDTQFARNLPDRDAPSLDGVIGIAAPHASPFGGWASYCDAYRAIPRDSQEKTFIVLGTSHSGQPDRFGLTRKRFLTPYGETREALDLVDDLEARAPGAILMEDYQHALEHTIEFQVVFLQHLFGPRIRVLPILVGSFGRSIHEGGMPEDNDEVRRFFGALGEIHARRKNELVWVLGVDMAHMGARYQDRFAAYAHQGEMLAVSARDKDRIARIEAGDARGFWDLVQENQDDLKWCGSAPFYTFLKAVPEARARMLRYQHWQIDPQSVVSFAAMAFTGS